MSVGDKMQRNWRPTPQVVYEVIFDSVAMVRSLDVSLLSKKMLRLNPGDIGRGEMCT